MNNFKKQPEVSNMNTEQQFVDLIKEGKVADAMQLIKTSLTEMAGSSIVDTKFQVAEGYGMKKKEMKEEGDYKDKEEMSEEDEDKEDDDKESDSDEDEDEEDMDEKKKKMSKKSK